MKYSTRLNIKLLQYAVKEKIDKPIALYYLVRAKYKNGTFYNYTPYKLSKQTGLHYKTVNRYVKRLMAHGLAEMNDKNLVIKKAPEKSKTVSIQTAPYMSYKSMQRRIRLKLIQDNQYRQQYNIAVNFGKSFNLLSPTDKKRAMKRCLNKPVELDSEITPVITCTSAGRLFGRSKITANKYIHDLVKHNYITTKNKIIRITKFASLGTHQRGRYYFSNGYWFKHCGRSVMDGSYCYA